jgi:hypothetical protein
MALGYRSAICITGMITRESACGFNPRSTSAPTASAFNLELSLFYEWLADGKIG